MLFEARGLPARKTVTTIGCDWSRGVSESEEIAQLEGRRSREHRLATPPMRDVRQLAAFIRDREIVLWTGRAAVPNMAEAIAGRPLRGSWVANPEVHLIYPLTSRLSGRSRCAVDLGQVNNGRRFPWANAVQPRRGSFSTSARDQLSAGARWLLDLVEAHGEVSMDQLGVRPRRHAKRVWSSSASFLSIATTCTPRAVRTRVSSVPGWPRHWQRCTRASMSYRSKWHRTPSSAPRSGRRRLHLSVKCADGSSDRTELSTAY